MQWNKNSRENFFKKIIIVRCGGVRNFKYTKGIRIEGVHQDVTHLIHYEKERDEELARKTIRKMCLKYKVSYITTLATALAAVRGIEATKDGNRGVGGVRSLQEWHSLIK